MQSIRNYIPFEQRIALADDFKLTTQTEGTVLFADISGFTPLTQSLSQELGGKRGAEELTDHLNEIYGRLIHQAHQYRGSVISFSGDAITCWFDTYECDLGTTAKRAMAAAQLMQSIIAEMDEIQLPNGRLIKLGVKVGLATGPVKRFAVGKPDIQKILTIAGKTLEFVANAEKLANTGEIIISPETFAFLKDDLEPIETRVGDENRQYTTVKKYNGHVEPSPWPTALNESELDQQIEWLLPPVVKRLLEGQENFLAELRPTVPLFLRFDGIDYDNDDSAGVKLDAFIQWIQSVVNTYSGYLIQLTIGDKGSYLYVTFGALIAHEDDPMRALLSADTLRNIPPHLDFIHSVQIGVSYGHTYTGAYGGQYRKTYGVLGNDVNLAARLMGMAQNKRVLVSSRIKKATENAFNYHSLGQQKIKGLSEPIPIFELEQKKSSFNQPELVAGSDSIVIGREEEKALLKQQLSRLLQDGEGSSIIIEGEAGMGKSQLIGHFIQQVEQLDSEGKTAVYVGAGSSIEKSTPYHGWRSIFSEIFNIPSDANPESARESIQNQLVEIDPSLHNLAPLLSTVLPISLEDNELTSQMIGQARANSTNNLLIKILQSINDEAPLILILEDTHWLDSSSWTLIEQVRNSLDSMMLLLATRPNFDESISKIELIKNTNNAHQLEIDSLPEKAIEMLLCHRLKSQNIPEPLLKIISDKAEGNPFFSEEIAYALRDTGIIKIEDGVCTIADGLSNLSTFQFPDNIHGIITSRIDSLHPSHQLSLKVASIIGRTFTFDAIHNIHPVEKDNQKIQEQLTNLETNEFTIPEQAEADLTYLFKHIVIWEVAYSLMTFSQRKALHQSTAEWYEASFAENLASYYPLLVHHWRNAEDLDKQIFYLEKAGEQALNNYANPEALFYFNELLSIAAKGHPSISTYRLAYWQSKAGEAHYNLGQLTESREYFEKSLNNLGWPVPNSKGKMGLGLLKLLGEQTWNRFRDKGRETLVDEEKREALLLATYVYSRLSTIMYFNNNTLGLLYSSLRSLNISENGGPSRELARSYAVMCVVAGIIPIHKLAKTYRSRALEIEKDEKHLLTRAFVLSRVNIYNIGVAEWDTLENEFEEVISTADELGDHNLWTENVGSIAWFCNTAGKFEAAENWAKQYYDFSKKTGAIRGEEWGLSMMGQSKLHQGDVDTAVSLLSSGIPLAEKHTDELAKIINHGVLAWAYIQQNEINKAMEMCIKATLLIKEISPPAAYTAYDGYLGLAKAWLSLWEREGNQSINSLDKSQQFEDGETIESITKDLLKILKSYAKKYPICMPSTLQCEAKMLWLQEKQNPAISKWRESVDIAKTNNMTLATGIANQDLALHLDDSQEKEKLLQEAKQLYNSINATYYASRV